MEDPRLIKYKELLKDTKEEIEKKNNDEIRQFIQFKLSKKDEFRMAMKNDEDLKNIKREVKRLEGTYKSQILECDEAIDYSIRITKLKGSV